MKKNSIIIIISLISVFTGSISGQNIKLAGKAVSMAEISIIYDNYICTDGTEADWGFSCLVELDGKNILFDTGTKPQILEKNARITGVDFTGVDNIIISHNHHDHIGGLTAVLSEKSNIPVYLPYPPDKKLREMTSVSGGVAASHGEPFQLTEHAWTSGTMGDEIREQCLVIDHQKGLIVIAGCSHPGIADMLSKIKKHFNRDIYAVMGGFHLMNYSKKQIQEIIYRFNDLGVKKCGCTHCTGEKQIQQFREAYGDNFIEMGTGRVVKL
jgi:7,8-dihydropterin-6-yl-methyl-4-(beta-D-ribofuranosyl)aminobenzene 5'-phosphate synthase